jgi:pimeloyl-ACP methyl ester carboxylesterase
MKRSKYVAAIASALAVILCHCYSAAAQTGLSQNSGINSADTWVAATINVAGNGSVTLASPAYNPETQTTSATLPVSANHSFNLEAGYDTNGGLVVNIYPIASSNPETSDVSSISCIRYAGGQMTIFDQSGNLIPIVMPNANIPVPSPLAFLGTNPGSSLISGIVVPRSIRRFPPLSALQNGSVTYSPDGTRASLLGTPPSGGNAAWSYASVGSYWIAQSVTLSTSISNATAARTLNFSNVGWNDNPANDAVRAAAAPTVVAPPPATTNVPSTIATPAANAQYTANTGTINPTNCNTNAYNLGGSQNVVMMHGLNSSSCTWTRMANWLNQDFRFGTEVIPSIPPNEPLASQGSDLAGITQQYPGTGYILMGHSQGGLASRWAAQYFQTYNPVASTGVITIDSPNNGADFATNGFAALSFLTAWGAASFAGEGCFTGFEHMGCYIALSEVVGGAGLLTDMTAVRQSVPDMVPGSGFLSALNGYPEIFNRAAVIGYTPQRWAFTRVLTEKIDGTAWSVSTGQLGPEPCNPEDACGERAVASATEYFYDAVEIALVVDVIVGFFDPAAWAAIPYLVETLFFMEAGDVAYDLFMDFPGDGSSDGIVDGPGQLYLGATAGAVQYPIHGADSHSAALRSTYDHPVLDAILANQFHVPTQASCTFAASVTSLSESDLPASGSFNLLTGAGCQWSATSNAPWLSVTSGINGISGGAIDYSVLANLSAVPRQGAIQAGNGLSSTVLNFYQAGVCTYTLSPGPEIASPASGETSSITVNTEMNCPWTVSTTTSWLSIVANPSGLGTGSFTFAATPNTTNGDRQGSILLMGQSMNATLNVIDGSPIGTPGMATVTVQGAGQTGTFSPCPPYPQRPCVETMSETGTISITIAGATFSTPYGGYLSTAFWATRLANQMNGPLSPFSVTVSGSTINISSTVSGADTNYPLSTSFTFNQECNVNYGSSACLFNNPAFTAAASGSQLAGGTN